MGAFTADIAEAMVKAVHWLLKQVLQGQQAGDTASGLEICVFLLADNILSKIRNMVISACV